MRHVAKLVVVGFSAAALMTGGLLVRSGIAVASASDRTQTFGGAQVVLSVSSGQVGTPVTITGTSFPPNATLAVYIDSPNPYVASPTRLNGGGPQTDAGGSFSTQFGIPTVPWGPHSICADTGYPGSAEPAKVNACTSFAVEPKITLSANSGDATSSGTITGNGYPAFALVGLYWDNPGSFYMGTPGPLTNSQGAFTLTVQFGSGLDPGPHQICGDTGYSTSRPPPAVKACAQYTFLGRVATLALSVDSGVPGTPVTVTGQGFYEAIPIRLVIDGHELSSTYYPWPVTDRFGAFQTTIPIRLNYPDVGEHTFGLEPGLHKLCAVDSYRVSACSQLTILEAKVQKAMAPIPPPYLLLVAIVVFIAFAGGAIGWAFRATRKR
jgi:hypothetical protein